MKSLLAVWAVAAALTAGARAGIAANVFLWSYSGAQGYDVQANGLLAAHPLGGNSFRVITIEGQRNGVPILWTTDYAGQDDLIFTFFPALDRFGLAFADWQGNAFKLYFDPSPGDPYFCGVPGYCELGPGTPGSDGLAPADARHPIAFHVIRYVFPEPATWSLALVAGSLAWLGARRGIARRA